MATQNEFGLEYHRKWRKNNPRYKGICKTCEKQYEGEGKEYCSRKCMYSSPTKNKQNSIKKTNNLNPMWKGEKVGLCSLHEWVRLRKPKSLLCEQCHINKPKDLANISQEYKRDIEDFEWLCRKCHMNKDGRIKNLKQYTKKSQLNFPPEESP